MCFSLGIHRKDMYYMRKGQKSSWATEFQSWYPRKGHALYEKGQNSSQATDVSVLVSIEWTHAIQEWAKRQPNDWVLVFTILLVVAITWYLSIFWLLSSLCLHGKDMVKYRVKVANDWLSVLASMERTWWNTTEHWLRSCLFQSESPTNWLGYGQTHCSSLVHPPGSCMTAIICPMRKRG